MTSKYPTLVKWGKESVEIEFDPAAGVAGLKKELQDRTGVPMDRMKIMPKSKGLWKGVLKDDTSLADLPLSKISPPIQMLLMGSATLPVEPVKKTVFLEDLPPEEAAKMVEPSGLINLGNTCYLNSVVQCLRVVPHLRDGLRRYIPNRNGNNANNQQAQLHALLLTSLLSTMETLDKSPEAVSPNNLVMATKMVFPQMAQTGPQGQPMQQDAEEFYSSVMNVCSNELRGNDVLKAAFTGHTGSSEAPKAEELNGATNVIDAVFGMKMEEVLTCDELSVPEADKDAMETEGTNENALVEPPVVTYDLHRKLVCNIQGGSDTNSQVNITHIAEGIQLSLTGKLEKYSDVLGRNAQWTRSQKIARLPPYLVVQFGRFYWKATPDSQDHAGVKCKVMKPVAFHSVLDIYDFCNDKVKSVLKVSRDKAAQEEEDRVAKKLRGEDETDDKKESGDDAVMEEDTKPAAAEAADDDDDDDEDLKAALAMSVEPELAPVGPGLPANFQGLYELFAVVTHKGRDADGGHYMGWVKADNSDALGGEANATNGEKKREQIGDTGEDNDDWFVFDDDEVSPCKTEDILKLKGGGDWHMSYLNFYRAKK
mmetsp:Transcript_17277/g.36058  ORF Transcript_17277/g.36058 Transcript_17277/m.36058 type:complete len:595 (+) Transcript_17277:94-1878(+)|eukprot:CAMPEP_0171328644 /NCGR_PEP_ID=MMETSP0878-20121228/769_1 /TAXON_ID=67004 /ORGANISM="Thalassiosira weissflogii, Strain CCMP1336" /LENGTH=594 /DNA_ID=CAMNT_0011828505 /DNA_START=67 /DNA_END=1851 /DNA_ORIENTATION=+